MEPVSTSLENALVTSAALGRKIILHALHRNVVRRLVAELETIDLFPNVLGLQPSRENVPL